MQNLSLRAPRTVQLTQLLVVAKIICILIFGPHEPPKRIVRAFHPTVELLEVLCRRDASTSPRAVRARLPMHSCGPSRNCRGAHTMPSHRISGKMSAGACRLSNDWIALASTPRRYNYLLGVGARTPQAIELSSGWGRHDPPSDSTKS